MKPGTTRGERARCLKPRQRSSFVEERWGSTPRSENGQISLPDREMGILTPNGVAALVGAVFTSAEALTSACFCNSQLPDPSLLLGCELLECTNCALPFCGVPASGAASARVQCRPNERTERANVRECNATSLQLPGLRCRDSKSRKVESPGRGQMDPLPLRLHSYPPQLPFPHLALQVCFLTLPIYAAPTDGVVPVSPNVASVILHQCLSLPCAPNLSPCFSYPLPDGKSSMPPPLHVSRPPPPI